MLIDLQYIKHLTQTLHTMMSKRCNKNKSVCTGIDEVFKPEIKTSVIIGSNNLNTESYKSL